MRSICECWLIFCPVPSVLIRSSEAVEGLSCIFKKVFFYPFSLCVMTFSAIFLIFLAEKTSTALVSTSMYHQLKKFAWKDDKRREGRIHDKEEKAVDRVRIDKTT